MRAGMARRSATVVTAPSPRALDAAATRLRSLLPHATLEGAATAEGFRWSLRAPEEITVHLFTRGLHAEPDLRLSAPMDALESGMELQRYSIRSARYVFLWLILHVSAVGPIAFFFWDPLALRRMGGLLPNLLLFLPLGALVGAMLSLLLAILKPRWTNLGAILTPRGTATGNAWIARGDVAPLRQILQDPRSRGILEARGVYRMSTARSTLSIEARGPTEALRVPRGEALLLERGYGEEVQRGVDGRFAAALAGQVVDLISVARILQAQGGVPGSPGPQGTSGLRGRGMGAENRPPGL
jgi:hypothetical protein